MEGTSPAAKRADEECGGAAGKIMQEQSKRTESGEEGGGKKVAFLE